MAIIFSDGFESGDFSVWPTTEVGGVGSSATVENLNIHHGVFNAKFVAVVGGWANSKTVFAAAAIVYMRGYIKITSLPDVNGERIFLHGPGTSNGQNRVLASIVMSGGVVYWELSVRIAGVYAYYLSAVTPIINRYYCVEVLRDVTNQTATLWVDGVKLVEQAGLAQVNNSDAAVFGVPYTAHPTTVYGDCAVVADARIYCEGVAPKGSMAIACKIAEII